MSCPKIGNAFYGQSGNHLINTRSYSKLNEKGQELPDDANEWFMVKDNVTGLIWEVKQAKDDKCNYLLLNDSDNTYSWYNTNAKTNGGYTGTFNDGHNTEQYIKQMNHTQFGGYSDWRLPSIKELTSLANIGTLDPSIDNSFWTGTQPSFYWSSTPYEQAESNAWGVNFSDGSAYVSYKSKTVFIRAVRGRPYLSFDYLFVNGDGTITDTRTGLMWQAAYADTAKNWEDALQYCKNLNLAGYSDWRLPEKEELRSIIDYHHMTHPTGSDYFETFVSNFFWSSTSLSNGSSAWGLYLNNGFDYMYSKIRTYGVRAVRGGQPEILNHLVIVSPKQSSILAIGSYVPIIWQSAGIYGNVRISLSRHGGKDETFEPLAQETENDGYYEWQVTGPQSVSCVFKIEPLYSPDQMTQQGLFAIKYPDIAIHSNINTTVLISGPEHYTQTGKDMIIADALPGQYTIDYDSQTCWQTPAQESQTLTWWGSITFSGSYQERLPESVQNLRANYAIKTFIGNNQITVEWQPVDQCLKGYAFVWDRQEKTIPPDTISGQNHQTTSPVLDNGKDHWFHIKSINIHGKASETAHIGPFYIDTSLVPNAPEHIILYQNTTEGVLLKWLPIDTVTSYTVYRSQNEQALFYPIHSEPVDYYDAVVNGFWDTGILPGTTYYYKIKSLQSGFESQLFSNTLAVTVPVDHSGFDIQFISSKHDIVLTGSKVIYDILLTKAEAFQGNLEIWCTDLPEHITYELSVNQQTTSTRLENVQLLPTAMTLTIFTGSATLAGEYQFNLQCLNVGNASGYQQKTFPIDLTVVPLKGLFVDLTSYHIHKNETVSVFGKIYPQKSNQSIKLEAWSGGDKYSSIQVSTQFGWFENSQWITTFAPGLYTIKAIWEDTGSITFTYDAQKSLIIEKMIPQLNLSSKDNQVPAVNEAFTINVHLEPSYESETIWLSVINPDNTQQNINEFSLDRQGQFQLSSNFFNKKGKYTFKAYFMGNDSSIGCESNEYAVMVGNTGCAILIGGGEATSNNTSWNVTKKLLTDAYLDFKRMGFSDDMIYLMINSQIIDITGDDIPDNIVDQPYPSVNEVMNTIENQFSNLLTEKETLYLYMMGHGYDNAKFQVYGTDEKISSEQLNTALNSLQEKTNCSVVIILECCYSGVFIPTLHHPKRLIITSVGNEPYNTDASGNISLSRYLFSRLCKGDSIEKAFEYARSLLTNNDYPEPLLDDYFQDDLWASSTYLPERLQWNQPEISQVKLYPIVDGNNTLSVRLTVESLPETITKVWAQVIPPDAAISSGTGIIRFPETTLHHEVDYSYSGDVSGFSYDGIYTVIFYAQNKLMEVSEPVQLTVRAINIGPKTDYNEDGQVNMMDMILVLKSLCGMNDQARVDLSDAVFLMQKIGLK